MTAGAEPAVDTRTGLGQDGGHISAAGTFACLANISRRVAGGGLFVLRGDVPPAPAVVVTCNGTVTAGMCHYPAASGPFTGCQRRAGLKSEL